MGQHFKIISVGWDCAAWVEQTLRSVERQEYQDWQIHVVDDCSGEEQQEVISNWCDSRDERWTYHLNDLRLHAVRNQYEGIRRMNPEPDDVIVFLDLDGDQLATTHTLDTLVNAYSDGTQVVYGSYRAEPRQNTDPGQARPFPPEVEATGSYREYVLTTHNCFNHLRTVRWETLSQVPLTEFQWPHGHWFEGGTDYVVMVPSLEIAAGRYKCLQEITLIYNHNQPHPDNMYHPEESARTDQYILKRPRLR